MSSTFDDVIHGVTASVAMKAPVRVATTANITLSGEQTIDGVAVVEDDRVLVKDQTTASENGIYVCSTVAWERARDFDGNRDVVKGTMVRVASGSTLADSYWAVSTADPITIGTSSITFTQSNNALTGVSAFGATVIAAATAAALRALQGETRVDFATAAGTVDAITADFTINFASWDQTAIMAVEASGANTSATPTFSPDGLTAKTIIKGANAALVAGDIPGASYLMLLRYDTSLDKVQLLNPATGVVAVPQPVGQTALNVGATVTLGSNALTFALKGADGNNPSTSNPVDVYFQSATVTTGTATKRSVTGALSITIPSTATVGTLSGRTSRIYFGLLDNAGTLELCYWNAVTAAEAPSGQHAFVSGLFRVDAGAVYTTVANTTGSDSAGVIYSDSARSNVRVVPIAYVDSDQATAGTWATAIISVTLIGPNTPTTGDIITRAMTMSGELATGTTTVPMDDTTPVLSTEGDAYLTLNYTPKAKANVLAFEARGSFANAAATDGFVMFLSRGVNNHITALAVGNIVAAGDQITLSAGRMEVADTTTQFTAMMSAGGGAAGTTTFNGRAGGRLYEGTISSYLQITELAA